MSTTPSRPRTARMPRPKGWRICCRPMPGAPCRPSSRRSSKALEQAAAPGRGHRRRRQDLDQARPARQPARQGRRADHRRRHGQHVPAGAGQDGRQVAGRARPGRHRARDHGRGQGAQAARSCCRSTPSWRRNSRRMRPRASSTSISVGDDDMILDIGPRSIEHVVSVLARVEDAGLERPVRRLRDGAVRQRHGSRSRKRRRN